MRKLLIGLPLVAMLFACDDSGSSAAESQEQPVEEKKTVVVEQPATEIEKQPVAEKAEEQEAATPIPASIEPEIEDDDDRIDYYCQLVRDNQYVSIPEREKEFIKILKK